MICSSLNLDRFIVRLPQPDQSYTILEEFRGLRSLSRCDDYPFRIKMSEFIR
jgi:hypothetical protein